MMHSRRGFLACLGGALITGPAIVRASSIMPIKPWASGGVIAPGGWGLLGEEVLFHRIDFPTLVVGENVYRNLKALVEGGNWAAPRYNVRLDRLLPTGELLPPEALK